jgi:hypothetical protein
VARRDSKDQDQLKIPGLDEREETLAHPSDGGGAEQSSPGRSPFAMGKVTPASSETHLAPGKKGPPFPGPWAVKAVVRDRSKLNPESG